MRTRNFPCSGVSGTVTSHAPRPKARVQTYLQVHLSSILNCRLYIRFVSGMYGLWNVTFFRPVSISLVAPCTASTIDSGILPCNLLCQKAKPLSAYGRVQHKQIRPRKFCFDMSVLCGKQCSCNSVPAMQLPCLSLMLRRVQYHRQHLLTARRSPPGFIPSTIKDFLSMAVS